MAPEMDYKAINERVEAGVKKEKNLAKFILFAVNLGLFVVFLSLAWSTYLSNGGVAPRWEEFVNLPGFAKPAGNPATSALVMLTVGWAVALLFHVIGLIMDTSLGERSIRDRVTGREMRKELARLQVENLEAPEKLKVMMRLTDDGELEALDEAAEVEVQIQQDRKV